MSSYSLREYQNHLNLTQYSEFTNAMKHSMKVCVCGTPILGFVSLAMIVQLKWRNGSSTETADPLEHVLYGNLVGLGFALLIWSLFLALIGLYIGYSRSAFQWDFEAILFYTAAALLGLSNTLLYFIKREFLKNRIQSILDIEVVVP